MAKSDRFTVATVVVTFEDMTEKQARNAILRIEKNGSLHSDIERYLARKLSADVSNFKIERELTDA
jgi:hypothetical protein